ncbi:MAG: kelch repeat-containing protein [Kofleriaceae bacterium]
MRGIALAIALVATACVRTSSVTCPDGTVCREGTECLAISDGFTCAGDDVVCGNGRVDPGEACDDGNTTLGDGCSADCLSDETCDNGRIDPVILVGTDLLPAEQCDDDPLRAHASHDGCSSACTSETTHWSLRRSVPTERGNAAMVTDTLRERIIMFGGVPVRAAGNGLGSFSNETWELAADGWTQLSTELSPAPRSRHAMAFDGQNAVLFGGFSGSYLGDTWTLDGSRWTLAPVLGPTPRAYHAMAFMPGVGVVLFGGFDNNIRGDTWLFANGVWTDISQSAGSPPAREKHVMVLDTVRERIVMAGGVTPDGKYAPDTWEFDGTRWMEVATSGAPALEQASAAFDRSRGQVIMQGGYGFGTSVATEASGLRRTWATTYAWNGSSWIATDTPEPQRLAGPAATDPLTGEVIVYAGLYQFPEGDTCLLCTSTLHDTWRWNGTSWEMLDHVEFPQLNASAGAYDPDRRRVVIYGGAGTASGQNQVTDTYELGAGSWRRVASTGPTGRFHSAMAYAVFGGERAMYVFGGRNGVAPNAETWKLAGGTWTNANALGAIPARSHHGMAFDHKRGVIVLYGGGTSTTPYGDTWELDGTTWVNKTPPPSVPGPGPRMDHAMAYDPIRERVLLFGGQSDTAIVGGLWSWSGTEWTKLSSTIEPPARAGAQMAWDAARRRMVLFGGDGNDAWEWDGTAWSFVSVVDPPEARVDHVLVPSPTGDGVLAIGGLANIVRDDTLHLVRDSAAQYAACRSTIDDDLDGVAGCEDPDCWAVCTPWCAPGASCDESAPRCGDGTCSTPRETCGICPDDCGACP